MNFIYFISIFYTSLLLVFKPRYYYIPWSVLTFVSAFRFFVGPDFYNYFHIFELLNSPNNNSIYIEKNGELGYVYMAKIILAIGGQAQLQFAISSIVTGVFFYRGFKYLCSGSTLIFMIVSLLYVPFLYVASLNIVRQFIAAAIFVYAIRFIIERKLFYYLLWTFIASMFHMSALMLFPLYWLLRVQLSRKILILVFLSILALVFINPVSFLSGFIASPSYAYYLTDPDYAASLSGVDRLFAIIFIGFSFYCCLFSDRQNIRDRIISNSLILFSFITVCALHVYIFNRLGTYFKPALIFMIALYLVKLMNGVRFDYKLCKTISVFIFLGLMSVVSLKKAMDYPSYDQFTFNFSLFSDPEPITIYGDLKAAQVK